MLDEFELAPDVPAAGIKRAVVTVGTSEEYGFRRLIERLAAVIPPDVEVLWQTGATDTSGLPIDAHPFVPAEALTQAMNEADVVIAHAGTGSALSALQAGRSPVLAPRLRMHAEQVDDHQQLLAAELERRDLAVVAPADAVSLEHLLTASRRRVRVVEDPPPIRLES